MPLIYAPRDEADVVDTVRAALAAGTTLEITGRASRREFGRPAQTMAVLGLGAFTGVHIYEPAELVLTAGPSTPLAELEALLAANRQQLAFEPPDLGPLWGRAAGEGSLGGALSLGLGGSRRPFAGAPRDHFLGFKGVNGFGEAFGAGGRVVKNVTGYDAPKLVAGAFGTLCVLTEVTVKVLPAPAETRTLALGGASEREGLAWLRRALDLTPAVSAGAFIPAGLARRLPSAPFAASSTALIRLEGFGPAVAAAQGRLFAVAPAGAERSSLDAAASLALWRVVGGGGVFADAPLTPVWRLSLPPAVAAQAGEALRRAGVERLYWDWAGAAIWAEGPPEADGGAAAIRAVLPAGGHATLVRGAAGLRAATDPFQPPRDGVLALQRRVKDRFDPAGIFNPGRMYRSF